MSLTATDKPLDVALVTEATIRVDQIRIHPDADAEDGFITLYDGEPIELRLLELQNGLTQELVKADVPAGTYSQLRLHVASATLKLVNDNVYDTEDGSLHLTSQDTSGYKIFMDPPATVSGGFSTDLLLDVDLSKTFNPVPANDPLNANTYHLHPVIHVANLSTTGEIRGVVTTDDGQGGVEPVEAATVSIVPPGETDPANSIASTSSGADGAYAVLGLPPGTYDVLGSKGTLEGQTNGVTVLVGSATVADITLLPTTGDIHGVVTTDDGQGGVLPVADATVFIMPPGETDTANSIASSTSGADGSYAVLEIPPGTYDVIATKGALEGHVNGVTVSVGDVTVADVTIL